jgi:PAS domain S-box-containing protein
MLRKMGLSASILMPLKVQGRILGAIRLLCSGAGRSYTADDVQLAEDLARRAAVAIENAQLHRAVREQESELRLSHAAAHMGSWSWDLKTQRIFWSDEFKALHGLPPETEASFELGNSMIHPEDRDRVMRELGEAFHSNGDSLSADNRVVVPDGRVLWLQTRGRIQRDAEGKPVRIAGITIDVTESRQAEQALRRTEKLAAAGRLAATVAHEVNNPLEALVNLVYLARRVEGLPAEAASHLKVAEGELSRMAHIVRQTLGFYRESTFPQTTDITVLVAEVLSLYQSRAVSRGLTLSKETEDGAHPCVKVNAGEIKQVVANLVSNSIDATPPGGAIRVSTSSTGECVRIVVTDTGCGISEADRKRLFEPFFTTKADVGTGLGLWVSKGIVEKHGGTISVATNGTGPGTTMTVELPLV